MLFLHFFFLLLIFRKFTSKSICIENENFCAKCNSLTNLCLKCEYDIFVPNDSGGCSGAKKCSPGINYCKECEDNNRICDTCSTWYYPDRNGGCSYTDNCIFSYRGRCLLCLEGFYLIGATSENNIQICKPQDSEDFMNCNEIDFSTGYCIKCEDDFYLNSGDSRCTETEHCRESSLGKCILCDNGYYLDQKDKRKCKLIDEDFLHCRETEDGKTCSKCEDGYYFDEEEKCVNTNYCSKSKNFICEKCVEDYYLSNDKSSCVSTKNCEEGDKDSGICIACMEGFYLDASDGKCKSNKEDDDLKYCLYFNEECLACEKNYYLGEDGRCSGTEFCGKSENAVCQKCIENYFINTLNKCSKFKHCLHYDYIGCTECEEGYIFNRNSDKCEKIEKEELKNCKTINTDGISCLNCKDGFYLLQTDGLCHNNTAFDEFYKCAKSDLNGTECLYCENGFFVSQGDKNCVSTLNCLYTNEEHKCIECDENSCLDVKKGICKWNKAVKDEEFNYYYQCKKTNKEGDSCKECANNYTLNEESGLCYNSEFCELEKEGKCKKCIEGTFPFYYCLNKNFGCVKNYMNENCLRCDDDTNFDNCTECEEGYKLVENGNFGGEFICKKILE